MHFLSQRKNNTAGFVCQITQQGKQFAETLQMTVNELLQLNNGLLNVLSVLKCSGRRNEF